MTRVSPEHPRVRGENHLAPGFMMEKQGTSPRARGKLPGPSQVWGVERNIPACAGKTGSCVSAIRAPEEHPRVRGENCATARDLEDMLGTSPRARGKHPHRRLRQAETRNIPACAGKTIVDNQVRPVCEEHPRVRGENFVYVRKSCFTCGTSPRARGKPAIQFFVVGYKRNIPACAGKTLFVPLSFR